MNSVARNLDPIASKNEVLLGVAAQLGRAHEQWVKAYDERGLSRLDRMLDNVWRDIQETRRQMVAAIAAGVSVHATLMLPVLLAYGSAASAGLAVLNMASGVVMVGTAIAARSFWRRERRLGRESAAMKRRRRVVLGELGGTDFEALARMASDLSDVPLPRTDSGESLFESRKAAEKFVNRVNEVATSDLAEKTRDSKPTGAEHALRQIGEGHRLHQGWERLYAKKGISKTRRSVLEEDLHQSRLEAERFKSLFKEITKSYLHSLVPAAGEGLANFVFAEKVFQFAIEYTRWNVRAIRLMASSGYEALASITRKRVAQVRLDWLDKASALPETQDAQLAFEVHGQRVREALSLELAPMEFQVLSDPRSAKSFLNFANAEAVERYGVERGAVPSRSPDGGGQDPVLERWPEAERATMDSTRIKDLQVGTRGHEPQTRNQPRSDEGPGLPSLGIGIAE